MNQTEILSIKENRLFDLSALGLLKISGPGSEKLLQGQLSCDMSTIVSGSGTMGVHCNPQGRIISLFYAASIAEDFYLVMPRNLIFIAMAALKKYAPFFKAELQDATDSYRILGSAEAPAIVFASAAKLDCFAALAKTSTAACINLPSRTNRTIFLLSPDPYMNVELATYDEWQHLNMLEGIPAIYPETSGEFLPHDLNLPDLNAVSFTKGCYTGQEIIARMHYRGKPKKHLYRGLSSEALASGAPLYLQENPSATVIDCCQKVYNNRYALLFTSDEATATHHQLQTKQGNLIELQQSE